MASSFLMLLDDITSVLDDVAIMTKIAAKKTAGVLGDDLALNAQQVAGVKADRELAVVWAVAKGSLLNKAILVPSALAISAVAPWAIMPLLMVGGVYLCFEGSEKIFHQFFQHEPVQQDLNLALQDIDTMAQEQEKIKGAIRTDFILSAEIIVIALGTVAASSFKYQIAVLLGISLLMTAGVYGLVAGIVKLDDLGLYLNQKASALAQTIGNGLIASTPWMMRFLSIAGTVAMFLVGGNIILHGSSWVHELTEHWPVQGIFLEGLIGVIAGALALFGVNAGKVLRAKFMPAAE